MKYQIESNNKTKGYQLIEIAKDAVIADIYSLEKFNEFVNYLEKQDEEKLAEDYLDTPLPYKIRKENK